MSVHIYQSKLEMRAGKHALSPLWRHSTTYIGGHFTIRAEGRFENNTTIYLIEQKKKPGQRVGVRKKTRRKATVAETPREREES